MLNERKTQAKEQIDAIGAMAEMSLIHFRALINSGATESEAYRLTRSYIAAMMWDKPKDDGEG